MTVSSTTTPIKQYSGNGVTTAFSTVFTFNLSTDLEVILTSTAGVDTVKTLTTHYTVSGGSGSTGTVTMLTAPASGEVLTIRRVTARTQNTDYIENDSFPASAHEAALDKLTYIVQEFGSDIDRILKTPVTSGLTDIEVPIAADEYIKWNATADNLETAALADLGAIAFPGTNGLLAYTGTTALTQRTITGTSNEITVSNGSGESGDPTLSLASTLVLTGKTVSVTDSTFSIKDNSDATKILQFELSGITTGTTRTLTVPNSSGTIALTSDLGGSSFADNVFFVTDNTDATKKLAFEVSGVTTGTTRTLTIPNNSGTIALTSDITTVSAASQADQETGTSTTTYVSPGRQHFHPSAAKAWMTFDASSGTPTIGRGYNHSSFTDNGVGDFTINFTTSFSDTNYIVIGTQDSATGTTRNGTPDIDWHTRSTGSCRILTHDTGGVAQDYVANSIIFFGDF